jgi:bla regulator protein blaR1
MPRIGPAGGGPPPQDDAPVDPNGPTLFTALEEQLGLKLQSEKGKVDVIVIDHIDLPTEN